MQKPSEEYVREDDSFDTDGYAPRQSLLMGVADHRSRSCRSSVAFDKDITAPRFRNLYKTLPSCAR